MFILHTLKMTVSIIDKVKTVSMILSGRLLKKCSGLGSALVFGFVLLASITQKAMPIIITNQNIIAKILDSKRLVSLSTSVIKTVLTAETKNAVSEP